MGRFRFDRRNRLVATIAISLAFFVAEIAAERSARLRCGFSSPTGRQSTRLRETSVLTYA
ncbi:hypothetical protein HC256_003564 [Beauveria bassiana]|nr:hypothetical protein HC256_003564 [Beauveria bassiana]